MDQFDYEINQILHFEQFIAIATDDKYLFLFDDQTFKKKAKLIGHKSSISSIFYENNTLVSSGQDKLIIIWNLQNKKPQKIITYHVAIPQIIIFKEKIVCGDFYGQMQSWNLTEFQKINNQKAHSQQITNLKCNSKFIISLSFDNKIKKWNENLENQQEFSDNRILIKFQQDCIAMNENIIALGQTKDFSLMIINCDTFEIQNIIQNAHQNLVFGVSLYDNQIATGSKDLNVNVWNEHYELIKQFKGHSESIRCLCFCKNKLLSGSIDYQVKIWDLD